MTDDITELAVARALRRVVALKDAAAAASNDSSLPMAERRRHADRFYGLQAAVDVMNEETAALNAAAALP